MATRGSRSREDARGSRGTGSRGPSPGDHGDEVNSGDYKVGGHRFESYDIRGSANLVLHMDNRPRPSEGRSEISSLWGKLDGKRMGDRVKPEKIPKKEERLAKLAAEKKKMNDVEMPRRGTIEQKDLAHLDDVDFDSYRPHTRETKAVYEVLLDFLTVQLGGQPTDILRAAAHEVLAVLKSDDIMPSDKRKNVEELIGELDYDKFSTLVNYGKRITDFGSMVQEIAEEAVDEDIGMSVVLREEEEEEDEKAEVVEGEGEDDMDAVDDLQAGAALRGTAELDLEEDVDSSALDASSIDAYWLQREVSRLYSAEDDPLLAQHRASEVLRILDVADPSECENELVSLLGTEPKVFSFIMLVLKNRRKIRFVTLYRQAQNDAQKVDVCSKMENKVELQEILDEMEHGMRKSKVRRAKKVDDDMSVDEGMPSRQVLDIEALEFENGSHFMSNKECRLPGGTLHTEMKGYEEVIVPLPRKVTPTAKDKQIEVKDMEDWMRPPFEMKGIVMLNLMQSKMFDAAANSNENLLLCAPTGAGKTNVAMLTVLRTIKEYRSRSTGEIDLDAFKIIYIAPMKSLVQEMVQHFGERLESFGIRVKELSGDQSLSREEISETQIIVTTPEKWDIITRKSGDRGYMSLVKLLIIDEVHLLHDNRGPVLESLVARTIRQIETTRSDVRIVGLSATLPNFEDVAKFLRVNSGHGLFYFDGSYRPCPLKQTFCGITEKKALKRFQLMNEIVYSKVLDQAGKNQCLVFVHARKDTAKTARYLRDTAVEKDELRRFFGTGTSTEERRLFLQKEAEVVLNKDLQEILPSGFAIHHAGMDKRDRALVEQLFRDGDIQVLVSTATLAWGVNLPAHTVIIKGTQVYNPEKGAWTELSALDVMQMLGRAGRPQYDTHGEGVVITTSSEMQYYLSLMNQQLPIESQFLSRLADNLNAEVVLGTVSNLAEAVQWLKYTYLYVRMKASPAVYSIPPDRVETDPDLEAWNADLIHTAATQLDRTNLIAYDRKTGTFESTDLGRVASHFYLTNASVALYNEHLKPTMGDIEIFRLFSISSEFRYVTVREEEKIELGKVLERVPIPVKETIDDPSSKVNVLLQVFISGLRLSGLALVADMVYVTQSAARIMRALFEIVVHRGWGALSERLLELCKKIERRMWGVSTPLRQFKAIPVELMRKIEKKDFPWERFLDLSVEGVGELIRVPKRAKFVHRCVHSVPRMDVSAHVQPLTRSSLGVELILTPDFLFDKKIHGSSQKFWIFVLDVEGETILHAEQFSLKARFADQEHAVSFVLPLTDPIPPQYFVHVHSNSWICPPTVAPISFRSLILPSKYPPPTEILEMGLKKIDDLRNDYFASLYESVIPMMNLIQTNVFDSVYCSDANIMVGAPAGSGKTFIAELAILRFFASGESGKVVFVAPVRDTCTNVHRLWQSRFKPLQKSVVLLTGDQTADVKRLRSGDVIVSLAEHFDAVSRRWKQRPSVQATRVLILDELQMIGSNHAMEVVASRMSFVSAQLGLPLRVLGLSASCGNTRELADWLRVDRKDVFMFAPNARAVPLTLHIDGFPAEHCGARLIAMSRPCYHHVVESRSSIIYVPSARQAELTALDLLLFAAEERRPYVFAREKFDEKVDSERLGEVLPFGVGFVNDAMPERDRKVVAALFSMGNLSVVVVARELCFEWQESAQCVVLMDTQFFSGADHRYVDYPLAEVLQMIGKAGRPLVDSSGLCVVFCHESRKKMLRRFVSEPFPVESQLQNFLHDHLNGEVVTQTIQNKQDAVDWITWTFMYRRLSQNPNFYGLSGTTHQHLSDHLSELVEQTLGDLEHSNCILVENQMDVSALNLGMIAAYYCVRYNTVELFSSSLQSSPNVKLKGIIEILAAAAEFDSVSVRLREGSVLERLARHVRYSIPEPDFNSSFSTKVNVLLQSHFSRMELPADLRRDLKVILEQAVRLLFAIVDVIGSFGHLTPALAAMELCQMIVQAVWRSDGILRQVPHIDRDLSALLKRNGVNSVYDLIDMDDAARQRTLALSVEQQMQLVAFCNAYPSIELRFMIEGEELEEGAADAVDVSSKPVHKPISVSGGSVVRMKVVLERDVDPDEVLAGVPSSVAPYYPVLKEEGWWIVLGEESKNSLLAVKKVAVKQLIDTKLGYAMLEFTAPSDEGEHALKLFLMSDSYLGCDQEESFTVIVRPDGKSKDMDIE